MNIRIDYYTAPWCHSCKQLLPKVRAVAEREGYELRVLTLDEDPIDRVLLGVPTIDFIIPGRELLSLTGPGASRFERVLESLKEEA